MKDMIAKARWKMSSNAASRVEALADEIAMTDDCASCGHATRLPGAQRAIFGLPWACGWTGGPAVKRCDQYTEEIPDYKREDVDPID